MPEQDANDKASVGQSDNLGMRMGRNNVIGSVEYKWVEPGALNTTTTISHYFGENSDQSLKVSLFKSFIFYTG